MIIKNKRSLLKRLLFNQKFLALVGLTIIILISIPLSKNISQRYKINQQVKQLQQDIANLHNKNDLLKQSITYLESDQFVEEQARLKLGLKKEGESVAVVETQPNQGNKQNEIATTSIFNIPGLATVQPTKPVTNPQRWWKYFFKY